MEGQSPSGRNERERHHGDSRTAAAVLILLLKGSLFSRKDMQKAGFTRTSASRTLRRLREQGMIFRTSDGLYKFGDNAYRTLRQAAPEAVGACEVEGLASFVVELYGMSSWNDARISKFLAAFTKSVVTLAEAQ